MNQKLNPRENAIAVIQDALKDAGFDSGLTDGDLGPKTIDAIKSYQASNELTVNGRLNSATIEKLGVQMTSISPLAESISA
jgi:peptidoglycan hydrolase-like protein with peptidoglycan-binding domain